MPDSYFHSIVLDLLVFLQTDYCHHRLLKLIFMISRPLLSFLHLIIQVDTRGQSALPQHRLKSRDLVQARRPLNQILQPLLLLIGELDPRHAHR